MESHSSQLYSTQIQNLLKNSSFILEKLSANSYQQQFTNSPLEHLLDDTPLDSFLYVLFQKMGVFEKSVFEIIDATSRQKNIQDKDELLSKLEETSYLWGRRLANEFLSSGTQTIGSLSFEKLHLILSSLFCGGNFLSNNLLLRRMTSQEIEYEVMSCPHYRISSSRGCELESKVFEGFVSCVTPKASFKRSSRPNYCFDRIEA